jgi:F0F1-type ATP synthase assembly protein I
VTAWLLLLPAALVVMCLAAYTLLRDGSHTASSRQLHTCAATSCRLGVLSGLLLALGGLGCLDGAASTLGWAMIVLGLLGATAGYLVFRRYLAEPTAPRSVRRRENPTWQ